MRRPLLGLVVCAVIALGALSMPASAASPDSGTPSSAFAFVPAAGYPTLPVAAFFVAEHFTYSLLNVRAGEDGKQVYAEITPYVSTACGAKQEAILKSMAPAIEGLTIVLQSARQSGPSSVAVEFGGVDELTKDAILSLVNSSHATMSVGLVDTGAGWRVSTARILDAKNSRPACS